MDELKKHYEVLELAANATPQAIKAAYRRLVRRWHPDQFGQDAAQFQLAEEKIKQINIAYEALKNSQPLIGTNADPQTYPSAKPLDTNINVKVTDPAFYYQRASEYANQKDYIAAAESLSLAIRLNPTYAEAYRYRGLIYSLLGYELRAEADLVKAANLETLSKQSGASAAQTTTPRQPNEPKVEYGDDLRKTHAAHNVQAAAQTVEQNQDTDLWESTQLVGHGNGITSLALSRKVLISADLDGQIHLWNLTTQKCFCTLSKGQSSIHAVATTSEGQFLASGDEFGRVDLWHLPTSSVVRTFDHRAGAIRSLTLNQQQGVLIAGTETGVITIWNLRSGQLMQKLTNRFTPIHSIQYVAKHKKLVAGCGDGFLRVWDVAQKYALKRFEIQGTSSLYTTLVDPDCNRVILAGTDGLIRTWSLLTEVSGATLQSGQGAIRALALSPQRTTFASGGLNASVHLWNLSDGERIASLTGHQAAITAACFYGAQLITSSLDRTIRLWNIRC